MGYMILSIITICLALLAFYVAHRGDAKASKLASLQGQLSEANWRRYERLSLEVDQLAGRLDKTHEPVILEVKNKSIELIFEDVWGNLGVIDPNNYSPERRQHLVCDAARSIALIEAIDRLNAKLKNSGVNDARKK